MSFWRALTQPIIGLAPMDGMTDAAFRFMVATQAQPDVTFTEFTSVHDICAGPDHLLNPLLYSEYERPVVAQVYGKDPALFYRAAHVVCELGFDGLDINMGCPSRSVASSGAGAGLIRTPDLAHVIMRAARQGIEDWATGQTLCEAGLKAARVALVRDINLKQVRCCAGVRQVIPLSVKTRLGYDSVVVESWIEHLLRERPAVISVHGRTLAQMYRGEADWSAIARAAGLVKHTNTLILGNGDIHSMYDVVRRVRETGVHGVLVGRGTLGNPWFFRTKEAARSLAGEKSSNTAVFPHSLAHASFDKDLTLADRFSVMLEHARAFETMFGAGRFPRIRKHLGWYCKGFPNAAAMRERMVRTSSSEEVGQVVAEYLAHGSVALLSQENKYTRVANVFVPSSA